MFALRTMNRNFFCTMVLFVFAATAATAGRIGPAALLSAADPATDDAGSDIDWP